MVQKIVIESNGHIGDYSKVIKVASKSRSTAVAGAIAGVLRDTRTAEIQAIGAGAVNQAVKALAIARSYLEGDGIDFFCVPQFIDLDVNDQERTVVQFSLEAYTPRNST